LAGKHSKLRMLGKTLVCGLGEEMSLPMLLRSKAKLFDLERPFIHNSSSQMEQY